MSTYQHDFTKPVPSCYGVLQPFKNDVNVEQQQAYYRRIKCAQAFETQPIELEWTGIGLMGKKLHPRLIPGVYTDKQLEDILQPCCKCNYCN